MKQRSAKFLLKRLNEIAKFEKSHNRFDNFFFFSFFSIRIFFHGHWRLTGQQGEGGDHLLFHSTTSTRSRTFRHLFATLHVTWLSHIFNRIACIYQTATRWDLPPYRITIWLTDDVTLSFCLFTWWFDSSFFCYSNLRRETGGFELASTVTLVLQANRLTKCDNFWFNSIQIYQNIRSSHREVVFI